MELSTLLPLTLFVSSIAIILFISILLMQNKIFKVILNHVKKLISQFIKFLTRLTQYFELLSDDYIKQSLKLIFSKHFIKDAYYTLKGIYIKPGTDKMLLKLKKYKIISILLIFTITIIFLRLFF